MQETRSTTEIAREFPRFRFCLLLVAVTAVIYGQVAGHGFVSYDDRTYVIDNPVVLQGLTWEGLRWAFTTTHDANWFPLTWLSHMIDVQLFGTNPAGHHLVNVAIHSANALILFAALSRLTRSPWRSAVVALLFALHPLRVESVAWASERKDVLSAFFGLLTIYAYAAYAARPRLTRYLAVVFLFACGLMAKAMVVTWPFLLLLLDFWPLGRLRNFSPADCPAPLPAATLLRAVLEKLPLALLATGSCVVTFLDQKSKGAVSTMDPPSVLENIGNALNSYIIYLQKLAWPTKLSVFYPFPAHIPWWQPVLAGLALAAGTALALRQWRRRPYLAVGWLWYLGTLVPAIGFIRVGAHAYADRYTYLPLVGVTIMLVWGVSEWAGSWPRRREILTVVVVMATAACAAATFLQVRHWHDTASLFRHALTVTENNYLAHNNLAAELILRGEHLEAEPHLLEVVRLRRHHPGVYTNLGVVYMMQKRRDAAIEAYRTALQHDPQDKAAYFNLGCALAGGGDLDGAYAVSRRLARLDPAQAATLATMLDSARRSPPGGH